MEIKRFKEFINENITDLLQGKSEEDVLSSLGNISDVDKFRAIYRYDLPEKYLPENEDEIREMLVNKIKELFKDRKTIPDDFEDVSHMGVIYRIIDDESHEIFSEINDKGIGIWRLEGENNNVTHQEIIHWDYLSNRDVVNILEEFYVGNTLWEEID